MASRNNIEEYHLHKHKSSKRQFEYYDLAEYFSENRKHSVRPHSHSYYQMIWFLSDSGKHFVDFEPYEIRKNTIFFVAKNQVHHFEERDDYAGILLHFNELFTYQNEEDIDIFLEYNVFNNVSEPYLRLSENAEAELGQVMKIVRSELINEDEFGHKSLLSNLLKAFLIRIERDKRQQARKFGKASAIDIRMVQFRKHLEENYRSHKSAYDYASKLNISTKTLNKIIKTTTGKTTSAIIQDRVIIEAKRQLMYSSRLVNEIAYNLGFEDPSYFIKVFKKRVSLTPTQFKNMHS